MSSLFAFLGQASKSKTIIVNTVTVVAGVVAYLQNDAIVAQHPEVVAILVTAAGVLNIALRVVTWQPLSAK